MTPKLLSTTLLAGVALAGAAFAQEGQNTGESPERLCTEGFLEANLDDDEAVSAQEAAETADVEFSTIDIDGDGMISQEEYLKCAGLWAENAASASVAASNEEVLEATEMRDIEFTHIDRDGDGTITQEEFMTWMEETHREVTEPSGVEATSATGSEEAADATGGDGDRDPAMVLRQIILVPMAPDADPAEMSREEMAARAAQQFIYRDTDANQRLDRQEWSGEPEGTDHVLTILSKRFGVMDADRSGDVSQDEFVAEAMRTYKSAQARAAEAGEDAAADPPVVYYRYPHPM